MKKAVYVCLFVSLPHFLVIVTHASEQRILRVDHDVGFYLFVSGVSSTKINALQ